MKTISRAKSRNHNVTTDTLREDLESLRGDVAELATDTRRYASEKVHGLTDSVKETANVALDRGRHVVGDEYDRALDYARQNPLATLSVGLLAGFLAGTLLRGRGH
jgi:ElaB/YqjD/DUF883 family membrane-anchored ribosome-binding protein